MNSKRETKKYEMKTSGTETWINVPEFRTNYYLTQKRGDQFRLLADLVKYVGDNWTATYVRSSERDFLWLYNVFKRTNIKTHIPKIDKKQKKNKYNNMSSKHVQKSYTYTQLQTDMSQLKAQMFSAFQEMTSIPQNVNEMCSNLGQAAQKVSAFSETATNIASHVEKVLKIMTDTANAFKAGLSSITQPIIIFICKLIALGYLLMQEHNHNIANVAALVTLILPSGGGDSQFIEGLIRVVKGMTGHFSAQGDEDGFFTSFFILTRDIVCSMFSGIDREKLGSMKLSSSKVKILVDYLRGATTIVDFLLKAFDKFVQFIGHKILKIYGVLPWFLKEDRFTPLVEEFVAIKTSGKDLKAKSNRSDAHDIMVLHKKACELEAEYIKQCGKGSSLEKSKVLPYLRVMVRHLDDIVAQLPNHYKTGKNPRRIKPFWVYIYGDPRVGKTAVFQPFIINALAKCLKIRDKYEDYSEYTFFRDCGQEFWETYNDQPVLWYNDLFQNYTDEQSMSRAIMELTNVVDDNLYNLNMAFQQKGAIFFNSEIVVSNAQTDMIGLTTIENATLSKGKHLYARRNVVCQFALNPKYATVDGTIDHKKKLLGMATEGNNYYGLWPKDMYIVIFHDPIKGYQEYQCNFEDAIYRICQMALENRGKQNVFKDRFYSHLETMWNADFYKAQGDEDDDVYQAPTGLAVDDPGVCDMAICRCNQFLIGAAMTNFNEDMVGYTMLSYPKFVDLMRYYGTEYHYPISMSKALRLVTKVHEEKVGVTDRSVLTTNDPTLRFVGSTDEFDELVDKTMMNLIGNHTTYTTVNYFGQMDKAGYVKKFSAMNTDLDRDVYARVTVLVETIGAQAWDAFDRGLANASIWTKFGYYAKKQWQHLLTGINDFINTHQTLVVVGVMTSIVTMAYTAMAFAEYKTQQSQQKYYDACAAEVQRERQSMAQSTEGRERPVKQVKRVQREVKDRLNAQAYDQQNIDVEHKVRTHMCKIGAIVVHDGVETDLRRFGNILNVGGDVFLCPLHFVNRWKDFEELYAEKGDKFSLYLEWTPNNRQIIDPSAITVYQPQYQHSIDICFLKIDSVCQMSWMAKFFSTTEDVPVLYDSYLYGMRAGDFTPSCMNLSNVDITGVKYSHDARTDPIYNEVLKQRDILVPQCYRYFGSNTMGGDCGLLLMNCDSRCNARKILGIHTAGGSQGNAIGISSCVFKEDVDEAMNYFLQQARPPLNCVAEECGDVSEITSRIKQPIQETGLFIVGSAGTFVNPETNKSKKVKLTIPSKSKINRSVMYDIMAEEYGPAKFAPAKLAPFINKEGEKQFPVVDAAKKLTKIGPVLNPDLIQPIVEHMYGTILKWKNKYGPPRVLTNDEMLNGFGSMKQMDMSTSPGYPYTLINNTAGKLPFVEKVTSDPNTYCMGEYLMQKVQERETNALNGVITTVRFADTLKDETRPLEKVRLGKTRLFQVAPMDYNMLLRKYFGFFIAVCHDNYIEGEMSVGINANSIDWTLLMKDLRTVGEVFSAGDCSNHDASCLQQVLMHICDMINDWYGDGPENARARRVLFASFLNSLHIVEDIVFRMMQGNKSGIALTTIINCLMEMFIIRLAYWLVYKNFSKFSERLRPKIYGDDTCSAVRGDCVAKLNAEAFKCAYDMVGFEYTSIDKSGTNNALYSIDEVSYLKRKFVYDEKLLRYKACLDKEVIYEICRWSESDPYNMEDQLNRMNSSLLELSNYSREEFQRYKKFLVETCGLLCSAGFQIDPTRVFDWDYCLRIKFPELFNMQ